MPNLTVYYPDAEQRNAIKDKLAAIAASFGYYTVHKSAERGDIQQLLGEIIEGEIALVSLPSDEQRLAAINELMRLADSDEVDWIAQDAFRAIAKALSEARYRNDEWA